MFVGAHLHCQHSKTQQVIELLSLPSHRAVFCRCRVVVPNHSHKFLNFLGFFFPVFLTNQVERRDLCSCVIFVAACPLSLLFPQQKTNPCTPHLHPFFIPSDCVRLPVWSLATDFVGEEFNWDNGITLEIRVSSK